MVIGALLVTNALSAATVTRALALTEMPLPRVCDLTVARLLTFQPASKLNAPAPVAFVITSLLMLMSPVVVVSLTSWPEFKTFSRSVTFKVVVAELPATQTFPRKTPLALWAVEISICVGIKSCTKTCCTPRKFGALNVRVVL